MLDSALREILDVVLRWIHVIAGTMWIGNSLLWNWLDRNLEKPDDPNTIGKIWLLHSGAFYRMEKTLLVGRGLPAPLHWFKWQAYTTWMSGALLLAVVYYLSGGALLVGGPVKIDVTTAIAIGAGLVILAWPIYNLIWSSPIARSPIVSGVVGLGLILGLSLFLTHIFSGRAAFLHVGAILATIMAGNVKMRIMPAQRQLVAAVAAGGTADPALSHRAKVHSIHNNYLTFPVIVLMVSSHFPGIYGHHYAWLLLGVLVVAGAAVRHFMNIRFTEPRWGYGLAATVGIALIALFVATRQGGGEAGAATGNGVATFAEARHVIDRRCGVCHSAAPSDLTFGIAPAGVNFDTPESIQAHSERIMQRAVRDRTMPPANKTAMTDAERDVLRRWISAGAKLE